MMKEVLITEGNGFRIVGKDVKTYGCSNFVISNMKLVHCSHLFRLYQAANLRNKMYHFLLLLPYTLPQEGRTLHCVWKLSQSLYQDS
jgi:hypothetical protein